MAERPGEAASGELPSGALERLPKWLICVPLVLQWLVLSVRHGSATLPSAANPSLTAGGLVGETKLEYFRGMGAVAQAATARHCAVPAALQQSPAQVRAAMQAAGLDFPVVAKPDLGMCGFGVRRLVDQAALRDYLSAFPAGQDLVLQEYLAEEHEAGIFYARRPGEARGRIIGLALRYFPRVVGNGVSSVGELAAANARARRVLGRRDHAPTLDLSRVPAAGEAVRLSIIGSTRVGGLYRDGAAHASPALEAAIDAIAQDMPRFHFGRFDVRFPDLGALEAGRDLRIMEINGAGSEAIQAWDPGTGLRKGLGIIFAKQRLLFEIGAANRRLGHRPIGLRRLAQLHFMQQRLLDAYPPSN